MYILLSPREEEVRSLLEGADEHIQQHIYQKDLKTFVCHYITYYAKVIVELEKIQTRNSTVLCLWCLQSDKVAL